MYKYLLVTGKWSISTEVKKEEVLKHISENELEILESLADKNGIVTVEYAYFIITVALI